MMIALETEAGFGHGLMVTAQVGRNHTEIVLEYPTAAPARAQLVCACRMHSATRAPCLEFLRRIFSSGPSGAGLGVRSIRLFGSVYSGYENFGF